MMGWDGGGMSSLAWISMGLFWMAVIGLLIWLVVRLLPGKPQAPAPATESSRPANTTPGSAATTVTAPALAILDERLASGEVNLETYRTIRKTLVESHEAGQ